MASLDLSSDELKAVEHTRQRLATISDGLASLRNTAFASDPLPDFESLQNSADILQQNLRKLIQHLQFKGDSDLYTAPEAESNYNKIYTRVAVHPSTNFPGRTHEVVLGQLLRKKPEPELEEAMVEGRRMLLEGNKSNGGTAAAAAGRPSQLEKELDEVWDSAWQFCYDRIDDYAKDEVGDLYTAEEREGGIENVRTGLRRQLEEDDEDDEDDDDDDDDDEDGKLPAADDGDDLIMMDRPPPPRAAMPAPAAPKPIVAVARATPAAWEGGLRLSVGGVRNNTRFNGR